jgi:ElaB/YqjD/DUF883 family membrane-anchored ribosome-binding protein
MAIDAQALQAEWNSLREYVKQRWNQLVDDDLRIQNGDVDQLIDRIRQKTGEAREPIERFLKGLIARSPEALAEASAAAGAYAQRASEQLRQDYGQVVDQAREQYDRAQSLIRQRPTESIVVAFGVGLVAGVIVGLALRSR